MTRPQDDSSEPNRGRPTAERLDDLESTLMLMGSDLESLTLALHEQSKQLSHFQSELERLRDQSNEPLPGPEDEKPPHY